MRKIKYFLTAAFLFLAYGGGSVQGQDTDKGARPTVAIAEVMYDSPLNEVITKPDYSHGEFVSLFNYGSEAVDISRWTLTDGGTETFRFPEGTVLMPKAHCVVAFRSLKNRTFTLDSLYTDGRPQGWDLLFYQNKLILANSGENLQLRQAPFQTPSVVDEMDYDGTSKAPDSVQALRAANATGTPGDECVSLQRVNIGSRHADRRDFAKGKVQLFAYGRRLEENPEGLTVGGQAWSRPDINSMAMNPPASAYQVTSTGAFTYSIPLNMPEGIDGFVPSLSVEYNSQVACGLLGAGFSLAGLSQITREGAKYYYDGASGSAKDDAMYRFSLDGQRLELVGGSSYGADGSRYDFAEAPGFMEITCHQSGLPAFTVQSKDGVTCYYGGDENALVKDKSGLVFAYLLREVRNASGLSIAYRYSLKPGRAYLKSIEYTRRSPVESAGGGGPARQQGTGMEPGSIGDHSGAVRVEFSYTAKGRPLHSYLEGEKVVDDSLLSEVSFLVHGKESHSYHFAYQSTDVPLPKLRMVEQRVGGNVLPPILFHWTGGSSLAGYFGLDGTYRADVRDENGETDTDIPDLDECQMGDFDGDGRTDILIPRTGMYLSREYGWMEWRSAGNREEGAVWSFSGREDAAFYVQDVNQDGLDDILICHKDGTSLYLNPGTGEGTVWLQSPATVIAEIRSIEKPQRPGKGMWYVPQLCFGDFDGDGRVDLAAFSVLSSDDIKDKEFVYWHLRLYRYEGGGYAYWREPWDAIRKHYGPWDVSGLAAADLDKDGKTEILLVEQQIIMSPDPLHPQWGEVLSIGAWDRLDEAAPVKPAVSFHGYKTYKRVTNQGPAGKRYHVDLQDVNGDGCPDLVVFSERGMEVYENKGDDLSFGVHGKSLLQAVPDILIEAFKTEDGWEDPGKTPVLFVDLNRDGLADILAFDNKGTYLVMNQGGTFGSIETRSTFSSDAQTRLAGDFDGDGGVDLLVLPKEDSVVLTTYRYQGGERVRLVRVQEGARPDLRIEYGQSERLFGKFESGPFPLHPLNAVEVVSSVYRQKGGEVRERNRYAYSDGIYHIGKQAFLGFREMEAVSPQGIVTSSAYALSSDTSCLQIAEEDNILEGKKYSYRKDTAWHGKIYPVLQRLDVIDKVGGTCTRTVRDRDEFGNILWEKHSVGVASSTDSFKAESESFVRYEYGSFGGWGCPNLPVRKISRSGYVGKAALCDTVHMEYDSQGRMTVQRERQGTTRYVYHSTGLPLQQTYEAAARSGIALKQRFAYSSDYRFLRSVSDTTGTRSYRYDSISGKLLSETDVRGRVTLHEYDRWGRKVRTTSPEGYITTYGQDWASGEHPARAAYYIEESVNPGITTQAYYDIWNNEIGTSITIDGQRSYTIKAYDTLGRLVGQSEPDFSKTGGTMHHFEYDYANRVVKETFGERATLYQYDGLETSVTRPDGIVRGQRKNAAGDVTASWDIMPDGQKTEIEYEYAYPGLVSDIRSQGVETGMEYDAYGRQTLLADPSAGNTIYGYNASDEMVASTDARGVKTFHEYDGQGRETCTSIGETNVSVMYGTEGNGKDLVVRKELDSSCFFTYDYDADGNLSRKTLTWEGRSWTYFYNHDIKGRLSSLIYPNGYGVYYEYDAEDRVERMTDSRGRTIWQEPRYDAAGRILSYDFGEGMHYSTAHNLYGRTIEVDYTDSEQKKLFFESYRYDSKGIYLTQRNFMDLRSATGQESGQAVRQASGDIALRSGTEAFEYDSYGRLVRSWMSDTAQVLIEYDAKGNILSKSDVGEYAYGEDRPFAVESIKVDASLAALHERLQNQDIEYTPFQRVESIGQVRTMDGKPMLVRAEFAYNPDLERMTMTTTVGDKPAETQFYFGDYEEKQIDGRTVQYCYVQSPAGLLAVAVKSPSGSTELYYAATDYLGSIRALVTEDGKVAERFEFDPWGRRRNPYTHQPLNPDEPVFPSAKSYPDIVSIERGFCGQEHLDDFDLINLNARLYDPILGRFLSPDPFVQQPDNTQNLNRYAYALNNPFNYMDPSGTAVEGFIAWGVVAFAAVIGGVVNVAVHAKSTTYVWQDFANFGIGFLISGISSMTGYGIAGLADKAGFIWGGLIGGLSGAGIAALTSPLQTGLNNLVAGSPFGRNMGKNVTTDILMGFFSGFISGSIQGVLKAKSLGLSWWDGLPVGYDKLYTPLDPYLSDLVDGSDMDGRCVRFAIENLDKSILQRNAEEFQNLYMDYVMDFHAGIVPTDDIFIRAANYMGYDAVLSFSLADDRFDLKGFMDNLKQPGTATVELIRGNPNHVRNVLSVTVKHKTTIWGNIRTSVSIQSWDSSLGRIVASPFYNLKHAPDYIQFFYVFPKR